MTHFLKSYLPALFPLLLLASHAHAAATNWFQNGLIYGQNQVSSASNAQTLSTQGQSTITNLNQGTNLVQPNGSTVTNLSNAGAAGAANGTGLGSYGVNNVNTCANYVIGTGGPKMDAECSAVGFASQTVNLNPNANAAYGITPQSSFLQAPVASISGAGTNINNLLPPNTTSITGSSNCTQQPVAPTATSQSCLMYKSQSTNGGGSTTYTIGSTITVTCTGGATLSTTSCTIDPPEPNQSISCLSTSANSSSGTPQSYGPGSLANVTCTGGSTVTNNTCTQVPSLQTTSNTMCYSQQPNSASGTSIDYTIGSYANVQCTAPANALNTSCAYTTALAAATSNQSCQISVPENVSCNQIASATVTPSIVYNCTSGTYTIWSSPGGSWGGAIPTWWVPNAIGSVTVTCSIGNTYAIVVGWIGPNWFPMTAQPTPGYFTYTLYNGIPKGYINSIALYDIYYGAWDWNDNFSWDGNGSFIGSNSDLIWAAGFYFNFPMSITTSVNFIPSFSDGCTPYGG